MTHISTLWLKSNRHASRPSTFDESTARSFAAVCTALCERVHTADQRNRLDPKSRWIVLPGNAAI
jgi:hypothetical protein